MGDNLQNEYQDFISYLSTGDRERHFYKLKVKRGEKILSKSEILVSKLKSYMESRDNNGKTLLMYDAEHGSGSLTKFFVNNYKDAGINEGEMEKFVAEKDSQGISALMHSIRSKNSIVRGLITDFAASTSRTRKEYEQEVMQATDKEGKTPLIYAVQFGRDTYDTRAMIGYADVNAKDKMNKTALNYALERGDAAMVEVIHNEGGKFTSTQDIDDKAKEYTIKDVEQTMNHFMGHGAELEKVIKASGESDKYLSTLINPQYKHDREQDVVERLIDNLEKTKLAFDNDKTSVTYKEQTKKNLREKQAEIGKEIRKDHFARVTNALGITKTKVANRAELIAEQEKIGEVLRSGGMTVAGKVIDATYKAVGKKPRLGKGK